MKKRIIKLRNATAEQLALIDSILDGQNVVLKPIEALEIKARTKNSLCNALGRFKEKYPTCFVETRDGLCVNIAKVKQIPDSEFMMIRNFGLVSLADLRKAVQNV